MLNMRGAIRRSFVTLLMFCVLCGCKGTITSTEPLLQPRDASFPVRAAAEVTAQTLDEHHVWESDGRKAYMTLVDGSYRVTTPDQTAPSPDRFLFEQIGDGQFVVQASNGSEWAYALIVHADMYYLFTFNGPDQSCTNLSLNELGSLRVMVRDDRCYVANAPDLIGLLRYLRRKFPNPTSAFAVREVAP